MEDTFMKAKKFIAALMSVSMLAASFTAANIADAEYNPTAMSQVTQGHWEDGHYVYFYDQLRPEAKRFYDALLAMYKDGTLKNGNGSYNLTEKGVVTQGQLAAYANGDSGLINTYGAARDAFCADHPEVFWVDFDKMEITVKEKGEEYTAYMGAGRNESYYRYGYASSDDVDKAVETVDAEVDKLVEIGEAAVNAPTDVPSGVDENDGDATVSPVPEVTPDAEVTPAPEVTPDIEVTPVPETTPIVLDLNDLRPKTSDDENEREKTDDEKKITAIHDALIRGTVYRLDTTDVNDPKHCDPANIGHVRTAYGPLVAHESLCEGYSKAMKLVLDKAGIPCVTVQGVYKHTGEQMELHMWNYVKIDDDGKWYAVDATFDDPSVFNGENVDTVESGHESTEYLLVGADIMDRQHVESGEMSECGFEFKYPAIEMSGVSFDTVYSLGGLDVQFSSDCSQTYGSPAQVPAFKVSYNGKGYVKAATEDKMYILVKFYGRNYETEGGAYTESGWVYADTGMYDAQGIGAFEHDGYTLFPAMTTPYMEFAVTDVPPRGHWYPGQTIPADPQIPDPADGVFGLEQADYQYYTGDPLLLAEDTGMLTNPVEVEYQPPFIQHSAPSMSGRFYIEDGSKECEIVFDKPLQKKGASAASLAETSDETETPLEYKTDYTVSVSDKTDNAALANVKVDKVVTNMRLVGDRTIKMTLTPDESWAGDTIAYDISITGLESKVGNLQPVTISFVTSHRAAVCAYRSRGYFFNLFAKPQLMENTDVSINDWKTSDGTPVDQSLSNRIALVVSDTSKANGDKMNDMIEQETGREVLGSSTYDLSLTICNRNILSTGTSVRLCVGFPYPYGPDDEGVKFTAYHFKKDSQGNTVGVEEIPCEVTRYGLVILCSSFSPFAIVASEKTDADKADMTGTVTVVNNAGGKITADNTNDDGIIVTDPAKGNTTLTITPDEGYSVDAVSVNGEQQPTEKGKAVTVTVSAEDNKQSNTIVDVKFAKTETLEKEEAEAKETGETVVKTTLPAPLGKGTELTGEIDASVNEDGSISATVKNNSTTHQGNAALLVATYENGRLKAVKRDTKTVYTGATETLTVKTFTDEEKGDTVKAFLWGVDSIYPVDVKTIQ